MKPILLYSGHRQLMKSFRIVLREKKWNLLTCYELRIVFEMQVSGLCFSLDLPLHAIVVASMTKSQCW